MMKGFGITGFRSFGPDPQYLYPMEKVNLIVGRNNAGKSNVLRAIGHFHSFMKQPSKFLPPAGLDAHKGERQARFTWRIPQSISGEDFDRLMKLLFADEQTRARWTPMVHDILGSLPDRDLETAWVTFELQGENWTPVLPSPGMLLRTMAKRPPFEHELLD